MKLFAKVFHSNISITVKLLCLNLMLFIMFAIIIGVMSRAFDTIGHLTAAVTDRNIQVIRNARMGRELSAVFNKIQLLITTFHENESLLKTEGKAILNEISRLSAQTSGCKSFNIAFQEFAGKTELLFRHAAVVNDISAKIRRVDNEISQYLTEMEEAASETMVEVAMKGEDISGIEQISNLIPSFREILIKVIFQFVNLKLMRSDTRDMEPIIALLDEMYLRVQKIGDSCPTISKQGNNLLRSISEYKESLIHFNDARIVFREQAAVVDEAKSKAVAVMMQSDIRTSAAFDRVQEENTNTIQSSIRTVYILSAGIVIFFSVLTYIFFLLNIRKPMDQICKGLESIGDGDPDVRIRLNRGDEWSVIEKSLNRMVSEVWNSYSELYRKNEELQQMHHELRKTQRYIKNIIDSMPSVMIGVDPEGRVTHWNTAAEKSACIGPDAIEGRFFTEVYPNLASQMENIRASLENRTPRKMEKQIRHTQDETRYEDIMIYPLATNGVEGAVIRVDDVTDRVRIEEMMIQTEKMMSVGGLAAGMAHEINNPLGVVLQGVQNAFRRLSPDLEANHIIAEECGTNLEAVRIYLEQRGIFRYLEGIKESGTRAARIVTNMLNFSRHSESNMTETDIHKLLDNTLELAANDYDLRKKYDFRYISIVREYDPELTQIICTATEIEQVVLNLLKNSAQAMAEIKGFLSEPKIILRTRKDGNYAQIEVQDNGPGMDEKTRTRIFEPFYTTKGVGVGTGLGLSVSFFIIANNHKGVLSVESEPGRGAKFIIRLPLEKVRNEK
jgi:PAS domain S-box-containing protein